MSSNLTPVLRVSDQGEEEDGGGEGARRNGKLRAVIRPNSGNGLSGGGRAAASVGVNFERNQKIIHW
ncbi:unnamed protein product [Spirodela intermedia]|uniref:Uncharacterized protein n=1 Tax=Spirodela intermedia TaxID=51605 RepID=A0A7I8I7J7_SPIIN|nr:unnamed protein product [Spirodela intermedia]CAA6653586.1 unnamed protein product [Spirodela intermedia]